MSVSFDSDKELVPEFYASDARFEINVPSKALAENVARLASLTSDNSTVPGSDLIKLETKTDDQGSLAYLELSASNGNIGHKIKIFELTVMANDVVYVEAAKLNEILKQVDKATEVKISVIGFEMKVINNNSLWRVKLPSRARIPAFNEDMSRSKQFDTQNTLYALRSAFRATANINTRASLAQIKFDRGMVTACDGTRLHTIPNQDYEDYEEFCLTANGAKAVMLALHRNQNNFQSISVTENLISYRIGHETLVLVKSKLKYPEVEKVFISQSVMNDTRAIVKTKEFVQAVKNVKVFADQALASVSISVIEVRDGRHNLLIKASDEIGNSSHAVIPCQFSGKDSLDINLNYKYLLDVLTCCEDESIALRVGRNTRTSKTSALFEDQTTGFSAVLSQTLKGN